MKHYQFQFSLPAKNAFGKFTQSIQQRILSKLHFFEKSSNPLHYGKKMSGYENLYRFRIGDYRAIVSPKIGNIITILLILKIGHRREVYE